MSREISISDAEWIVMKALWQHERKAKSEKMTLKEITEAVAELSDADWSYTTVRTMVGRLTEKGAITADESKARNFRYSAAVSEEKCRRDEVKSFVSRIFDGSTKLLISSLVSEKNLTKKEQETLLEIIDKLE